MDLWRRDGCKVLSDRQDLKRGLSFLDQATSDSGLISAFCSFDHLYAFLGGSLSFGKVSDKIRQKDILGCVGPTDLNVIMFSMLNYSKIHVSAIKRMSLMGSSVS